jgi:hypothetical protein
VQARHYDNPRDGRQPHGQKHSRLRAAAAACGRRAGRRATRGGAGRSGPTARSKLGSVRQGVPPGGPLTRPTGCQARRVERQPGGQTRRAACPPSPSPGRPRRASACCSCVEGGGGGLPPAAAAASARLDGSGTRHVPSCLRGRGPGASGVVFWARAAPHRRRPASGPGTLRRCSRPARPTDRETPPPGARAPVLVCARRHGHLYSQRAARHQLVRRGGAEQIHRLGVGGWGVSLGGERW